ncbi:hypothetical protein ACFFGR_16870 [Arthrobacter liuii]|uniref:Uncharacterized protein n=1 Tax=Arthrobacter liuii TaxID=1476996 RepID=A0ABQ2B1H3_9MICC|nr:hypothetical protein [Arthrobacter liuii]GGI02780.1 hypothetical protein GCM10007170_45300 [Arthrobacter liuii]
MISHPHFEASFAEALDEVPDRETGLNPDELYGVPTSWCLLNKEEPKPPKRSGSRRIKPRDNHLGMKGPAAADYIVSSAPDLV